MDRGDVERLFQLLASEQALGELFERNVLGFTNAYVTVGSQAAKILKGRQKLEMGVSLGNGKKSVVSKSAAAAQAAGSSKGRGKGKRAAVVEEDEDYYEADDDYDTVEEYQAAPAAPKWNPLDRKTPAQRAKETAAAKAKAPQFKSAEFIDDSDDDDRAAASGDTDAVLAKLYKIREEVSGLVP